VWSNRSQHLSLNGLESYKLTTLEGGGEKADIELTASEMGKVSDFEVDGCLQCDQILSKKPPKFFLKRPKSCKIC